MILPLTLLCFFSCFRQQLLSSQMQRLDVKPELFSISICISVRFSVQNGVIIKSTRMKTNCNGVLLLFAWRHLCLTHALTRPRLDPKPLALPPSPSPLLPSPSPFPYPSRCGEPACRQLCQLKCVYKQRKPCCLVPISRYFSL